MLDDGLTALLLPARLLATVPAGAQATALGLISAVGLLLAMLQPTAGALSDRLRPRWGRRGMIALGVGLVLLALPLFGLAGGLFGLLISFALIQVAASVAQTAQQGFIPDLLPRERRGVASGLKGLMDIGDAFRLDLRAHHLFARVVAARFLFLLGTYAVGRFLLLFVADRLGLGPDAAAAEAGGLLAGLALVTVLASPLGGWAADRFGRRRLMLAGALLNALGTLLLLAAPGPRELLLFGSLMALGSAAFTGANWALTADLAPPAEAARFMGLANIGTTGATAAAGLLGLMVDAANRLAPGLGYPALFVAAALASIAAALVLPRAAASPTRAAEPDARTQPS